MNAPYAPREITDEQIDQRAAEMMMLGGLYDPFEPNNFGEALSEMPGKKIDEFAELMRCADAAKVYEFVRKYAADFWRSRAQIYADTALTGEAETECRRCGGFGCKYCEGE